MRLYIPFIFDSHDFVFGYETGVVYEKMKSRKPIEMTIHVKTTEQIKLIALELNYVVSFEALDENFVVFKARPKNYDEFIGRGNNGENKSDQ